MQCHCLAQRSTSAACRWKTPRAGRLRAARTTVSWACAAGREIRSFSRQASRPPDHRVRRLRVPVLAAGVPRDRDSRTPAGGNVRFAFRHVPLTGIHPHALTAAAAAGAGSGTCTSCCSTGRRRSRTATCAGTPPSSARTWRRSAGPGQPRGGGPDLPGCRRRPGLGPGACTLPMTWSGNAASAHLTR